MTAAQIVDQAGRLLYGVDWQSPMSRDLGVNLRTMQRIAKAAADGGAYPVAPSVVERLATKLQEHSAMCATLAHKLGCPIPEPESTPAPIQPSVTMTREVLTAGIRAIEPFKVMLPGEMADAAFRAMAEKANLVVT